MSERHTLLDTIADFFVPIHPDGYKFVATAAALALLGFWLWDPLGWFAAGLAVCLAYFFRDPVRVAPLRQGLVISPADGRISAISTVRPPPELGLGDDERIRISIFLSLFDVHIQRSPVTGLIHRSIYIPGAFLNAELHKASEENERRAIVIETSAGETFCVVQIAGLVARRIVTLANEGESLGVGERFGLIRFGSRVDTYLPPGYDPIVYAGQTVIAGETVIAELARPAIEPSLMASPAQLSPKPSGRTKRGQPAGTKPSKRKRDAEKSGH